MLVCKMQFLILRFRDFGFLYVFHSDKSQNPEIVNPEIVLVFPLN